MGNHIILSAMRCSATCSGSLPLSLFFVCSLCLPLLLRSLIPYISPSSLFIVVSIVVLSPLFSLSLSLNLQCFDGALSSLSLSLSLSLSRSLSILCSLLSFLYSMCVDLLSLLFSLLLSRSCSVYWSLCPLYTRSVFPTCPVKTSLLPSSAPSMLPSAPDSLAPENPQKATSGYTSSENNLKIRSEILRSRPRISRSFVK